MSQQRHYRFEENRQGKVYMAMIMLLCLCVMAQMLGVPATLLHSLETVDALAVSVSEGFSVPSSFPQPTPSVEMVLVTDSPVSVHMPVLASALFHPPPIR
jgi:hypothetical protein